MHTEKVAAESKRLEKLFSYDILDTAQEGSFDRIARLARTTLQTSVAMISLVDAKREWVKSSQGLDVQEFPRESSFCARAIEANEPLVVSDATDDERFRDNPLVVGESQIRFYVGVPLTAGGFRLGALCVMDRKPRRVSDQESTTCKIWPA